MKLPDGTVLQVKVGPSGMPDPAKTPLFTVDTVGMLMNSKDKLAIWAIGGDVKTSSPLDITIEPLLMPGISVKTKGVPGQRFSFHGWDTDETPVAWKWLDDPDISYFPVRVSGRDQKTGETASAIACGAFNPMMKEIIKHSIEWGE
ncbi:MAG: hypothetical protein KGL39_60765, partial [Patescibacteria group bacterium]|nr:hypothetical protein [Patescibacteria group bacterium]